MVVGDAIILSMGEDKPGFLIYHKSGSWFSKKENPCKFGSGTKIIAATRFLVWRSDILPKRLAIPSDRIYHTHCPMVAPSSSPLPRPLGLAVAAGLLPPETQFLDYALDYATDELRHPADIVYFGYLLNSLNSASKRQKALVNAWQLTQDILIVAAEVLLKTRGEKYLAYDGEIPRELNPNYHYYQPVELKHYIAQTLGVEPTPLSLGVYAVFRDSDRREKFCQSGWRSPLTPPAIKPGIACFENHAEILQPLIDFFLDRGRLPLDRELPTEPALINQFGSINDAFAAILAATDASDWQKITTQRTQDLLIYLASDFLVREKANYLPINLEKQLNSYPRLIANDIMTFFLEFDKAIGEINQLIHQLNQPRSLLNACQTIGSDKGLGKVGKKLPAALYIHNSALHHLNPILRLYEAQVRRQIGQIAGATLIKFNLDEPKISYLFYPDFDTDPHPPLKASLQVHLPDFSLTYLDYQESENPPILHRKETFVTPDYPLYPVFSQLTKQEERLGLLSSPKIGTQKGWQQCLQHYGVKIDGHQIINCPEIKEALPSIIPKIERHRAAIVRRDLSRPMRLALDAGIFTSKTTFFDYGCGYGGDIEQIQKQGYLSHGWDPYYRPDTALNSADVVNLGYVINVIENPAERREALINAWQLTQKVLVVSALVLIDDRERGQVVYGDGVITRRNTFQKYYDQEELKYYIEQVLNVEAIPAALGIYFVFRDPEMAQRIRAYRFRSRTTTPRIAAYLQKFTEHQAMLQPLMAFVSDRGRLPVKGELPQETEIREVFGTIRRAFQIIIQATNSAEWDAIAEKRRKDLLTYLAVSNFGKTQKFSQFNPEIKDDIKYFFGSYASACAIAEHIIYSLNDINLVRQCCQNSQVGYISGNGFYIHISAIEQLEPLLRIYEGLVSRVIGRMDEATVVKFHLQSAKISYLFYPDFDENPHPILHRRMKINLKNLEVTHYDYADLPNPLILTRKERLVSSDYPLYEKFSSLTQQEENRGLLEEKILMYKRQHWQQILAENCAEIRKHRVYWRQDADPDRVKLLKSQQAARQRKNQH